MCLQTLHAHSQFCISGDHTLEATEHAIRSIADEEADEHFVIGENAEGLFNPLNATGAKMHLVLMQFENYDIERVKGKLNVMCISKAFR